MQLLMIQKKTIRQKLRKMNLIGAPYQIIIRKKTEGDLFEFKEVRC